MFNRFKRMFEKRSGVRDPATWLSIALGGSGGTASGVIVSPDSALMLSSYFAGLRAISEDIAKLPLHLFRRLQPRGKDRVRDHPVAALIALDANPEMSAQSFRETLTSHALGWGNGFAEIVRQDGQAVALWPIAPARVKIDRVGSQVVYVVSPTMGEKVVTFASKDMFHLHGLGFDGLSGYSVAHIARESIGAALAAQDAGSSAFRNGSVPGGILTHPGKLSETAKGNLRNSWNDIHRGTENTGWLAVLEEGIVYQPTAIPNRDSQWLESREFSVNEMSRWFRIPPHKIFELSNATYSNIESQSREYVSDSLQPWGVRWENEIRRKLLPDSSDLFAEHIFAGLLRGDTEARFNSYQVAINSGWMSRNEARSLENLNPLPGLDEMLIPSNTGVVDENDDSNEG